MSDNANPLVASMPPKSFGIMRQLFPGERIERRTAGLPMTTVIVVDK